MIASKKAKEVYGVEIIADAIKDAKMNAKNNNITNCPTAKQMIMLKLK